MSSAFFGVRQCSLLVSALAMAVSVAPACADEWEFMVSPLFLWGVSIDGDSTINGNTAPLDLSFEDEILENMEAVFTFHGEARRGDWTFFAEYQFIDLEPNAEVEEGPINVDADVDFEETMIEIGATWAFSKSSKTRWELLGGARYTDQDLEVDATVNIAPGPGGGMDIGGEGGDDWWHGLLGVRVFHQINEKWTLVGRADYGYGDSDNTAINGTFMFDYKFNQWGSVFVGARYLDYDYEEDAYGFDAYKAGPLAGLSIRW